MRSSGWSLDPIRVRVWKRPESSSSLTTYTHEGKAMRAPGERASHEEGLSVATESAGTLILDFQLPELWGNWFLLFKPPALWCFITVAKAVFGKYSRWSECRLGYLLQGAKPWRSWDFFFSSNVGSVAAPQSLCWKTLAGMRLPSTGLAYACAGWRGCLCWWTWRQSWSLMASISYSRKGTRVLPSGCACGDFWKMLRVFPAPPAPRHTR